MLPMFHSLTGCDTLSFLSGKEKKTAWNVWNVFAQLTPVLKALLMFPEDIDDTCMDVINRFVILLYDRTSSFSQGVFPRKTRSLDNIPSTQASLLQHVKRTVIQG